MVFSQIMGALAASETTGAQAEQAARMGFLEWALTAPAETPSHIAARADLARVPDEGALSPAARIFVDYLTDAARSPKVGARVSQRRRGGRRRVLH